MQTKTPSGFSNSTLSDVSATDKQAIVRCGSSWFSLPADSVREITIAPELVAVPQCHPSLAGLCHLRSEFIPVIALDALLDLEGGERLGEQAKLMVIQGQSVWALRIAEAASIESLETLVSPETRTDDGNPSPVMGTAMFRSHIVRVLDPNAILRLAQKALEDNWHRQHQPLRPAVQGASR